MVSLLTAFLVVGTLTSCRQSNADLRASASTGNVGARIELTSRANDHDVEAAMMLESITPGGLGLAWWNSALLNGYAGAREKVAALEAAVEQERKAAEEARERERQSRAAAEEAARPQREREREEQEASRQQREAELLNDGEYLWTTYGSHAFASCQISVENLAANTFRWMATEFGNYKFPVHKVTSPGVLHLFGNRIEFQNRVGGWLRMMYTCDYDVRTAKVISAEAFPHSWVP